MKKGCLIALGVIMILSVVFLGYYFYNQKNKGNTNFDTTKPEIGNILQKVVATGSIKPRKEVNIKPQVSGVIDELFVEAGQLVEKGQKLAKIKLVPSQVNINNAQSNVELARIRYDEARRELDRQRKIYDQKLDVEQAKVNYENATQEETRYKNLFDDGVVSIQEYNRFKMDAELKRTEFANSQIVASNNLKAYESELDIRRQERDAAINNLQLLKVGATQNSKQVSNIVTSTVKGMVLDVIVEEGSSVVERNNFNEGTTIASVADMSNLIFEGKVDESDVGKLSEGMPMKLKIGALEDETIEAILEYIAPKGAIEEGIVKFEIKAAINPSEDIFLRAGYSANADIIINQIDSVLSIKERDVIYRNDSIFVEVENDSGDFEEIVIKTGISDGINTEIKSGIDTTKTIKVQMVEKN